MDILRRNSLRMLNEFKFFDVTLAETYSIAKIRSFIFNRGIEMIFTLISNEIDAVIKAYITVKDAEIFSYDLQLLDENNIKISSYAQDTIHKMVAPFALSIGILLIEAKIGGYCELQINR